MNIHDTDDNECFKLCFVRYVKYSSKMQKNYKSLIDLNFECIKFPVKIRDVHKIENKTSVNISVFGYENKEKYPIKKMLRRKTC